MLQNVIKPNFIILYALQIFINFIIIVTLIFFYETPCRLHNVMINEVFVLKYLIKMKSYL